MENVYNNLKEIAFKRNEQDIVIDTYKNGSCTKCKYDCRREHTALGIEYKEIHQVLKNFKNYREPQLCLNLNHENETYHIPFRCPENKCDKCGKSGHGRQMCDTYLYFWNRLHHCGCSVKIVKRNKSRVNNGGGNHCCFCLNPIKYKDAYNNQTQRRLKCKECYEKENKRPLTPEPEESDKKVRVNTPEDPMLEME